MDKKAYFIHYCRQKENAGTGEWHTLWEGSQDAIVSPSFYTSSYNGQFNYNQIKNISETDANTINFTNSIPEGTKASFRITYTEYGEGNQSTTGTLVTNNQEIQLTPDENNCYGEILRFEKASGDYTPYTIVKTYNNKLTGSGTYIYRTSTTVWKVWQVGCDIIITKIEAYY